MRAAQVATYGPPDVVQVVDLPSPPVGPGTARVAVHAAAVNYPDVLLTADEYQVSVPTPFVPGSELAGVVVELGEGVGEGVGGLAVGDRVYGTVMHGAFAEEVVLGPASLRRVPDGVPLADAAAFAVAHGTAYHMLRSMAGLRAGDELVVLGSAGGVGLAAVQLGAALGAAVTAVASTPEKLAVAEANGATRAVDHRAGDLRRALKAAVPGGADVVIDPVGGALSEPALRSVRWGGRYVVVGFASGEIPRLPLNVVLLKGAVVMGTQLLDFYANRPDDAERDLAELTELLASGRIRPHIGARFPLDEAAAALRHVADGRAIGKVVIDVRPDDGDGGPRP